MKAAPFEYLRPSSLEEACAMLAEDDTVAIAGGQTLIPIMAMRLARPARLVDIQRIPGLSGIREEAGHLVIGATARQAEALRSKLVAQHAPLLAKALPFVGHAPTRSRGTVGGSVANADPAAEIPLVLVTLGGSVVARDANGRHEIAAKDFFTGPMMTSLPAGACLTEVHFPVWREQRIGVGFQEISVRKSDFAFAAAAAQVALDANGRCVACVIGVGAATPFPIRLAASDKLVGTMLADTDITPAIDGELARIEIISDSHASPGYRRRAAATLVRQAIGEARDAAWGDA